jgi:hypothetical protein
VNRIVSRAVKVGVGVSAAIGIVAFATSGIRAILLDAYLLAMGGVLLLALVRTTRARAPETRVSEFESALRRTRSRPRDSGELALVREIELSRLSAFHVHARLRPVLREIAAHRLLKRYGVDLDVEPGRARELVGPAAWELVRPERPPPADRLAVGPTLPELRTVLSELERV